jgi:hypothetical protein
MQRRIPERPAHSDRQKPAENIQGTVRCRNNTNHGWSTRTRTPTSVSPLDRFSPVGVNAVCPASASTRHGVSGSFLITGTYNQLRSKSLNKAGWPNGKALDYESRDCRFDPCVGQFFFGQFLSVLYRSVVVNTSTLCDE